MLKPAMVLFMFLMQYWLPSLELSIVNTIVEPAYFNKNFSILTEAVVTADLLGTLTNPSATLTLFAPDNAAFAAAGITSLEGLTASDLTPILTYHVLGSEVFANALPPTGSAVTTLNGPFYLSINADGVFINGLTKLPRQLFLVVPWIIQMGLYI